MVYESQMLDVLLSEFNARVPRQGFIGWRSSAILRPLNSLSRVFFANGSLEMLICMGVYNRVTVRLVHALGSAEGY